MRGYRLLQVLASFKPIQRLSHSLSKILGVVIRPIMGVKDGGVGMAQGLGEGIEIFCGYLSEESYGWGIYLL